MQAAARGVAIMQYAAFVVVLAVGFSACAQILADPRITARFVWKSVFALALYALQVAVGIAVMVFLLPVNRNAPAGGATAIVGWIALAGLGLLRYSPPLRAPPRGLMHVGIRDVLCLCAVGWGLADYAGLL